MSLITRCPACGTAFRVVSDQLRVSDGWVRCGRCTEVFDASEHWVAQAPAPSEEASHQKPLHTERGAAGEITTAPPSQVPLAVWGLRSPSAVASSVPHAPDGASMADPERTSVPVNADGAGHPTVSWAEPATDDRVTADPHRLPVPEEAPAEVPAGADAEADSLPPSPALLSEAVMADWAADPTGHWPAQPVPEDWRADPSPIDSPGARAAPALDATDSASDIEGLEFMRQARRQVFWRQTWVRLVLWVLSFVLLIGLAGQVVFHERHRLAARYPVVAPALAAACRVLGCRLEAVRQIDSILIDNSAFNKNRQDAGYTLALTLHNSADLPLATPAVELTLTDAQDQPVARRVLLTADLGAPDVLDAGADWSVNLPMAVDAETAAVIAGYRVLVFYP